MCAQDLESMVHQGAEFYSRLVEHLTMLEQNVTDFKQARFFQCTEQCKALGLPPPVEDGGAPVFNPNAGNFNYQFNA